MKEMYGKFRAKVVNVNDPDKRGSIKVKCPKLYGDSESPWCIPCLPFIADSLGIMMMPTVGEVVWIECEEGNPDKPIWVGSWWSSNKTPLQEGYTQSISNKVVIKTKSGHTISFYDEVGEEFISIKEKSGNEIIISSEGVSIKGALILSPDLNNVLETLQNIESRLSAHDI